MSYKTAKYFKEKEKNCSGIIEVMQRVQPLFTGENENIAALITRKTTFFIILQG